MQTLSPFAQPARFGAITVRGGSPQFSEGVVGLKLTVTGKDTKLKPFEDIPNRFNLNLNPDKNVAYVSWLEPKLPASKAARSRRLSDTAILKPLIEKISVSNKTSNSKIRKTLLQSIEKATSKLTKDRKIRVHDRDFIEEHVEPLANVLAHYPNIQLQKSLNHWSFYEAYTKLPATLQAFKELVTPAEKRA